MGAHTVTDPASWVTGDHWQQTSLFGEAVAAAPINDTVRAAREALAAADEAENWHGQRAALDQLARSLARQAQRRGRAPVPKRATARDAS